MIFKLYTRAKTFFMMADLLRKKVFIQINLMNIHMNLCDEKGKKNSSIHSYEHL